MAVGYGDGRVSIGPTMVGRVAVKQVTAVPAQTPRIRLDLAWTLGQVVHPGEGNPPEDYLLIDFGGELGLGADDLFVGTLVRDGSRHPLRSLAYVDTQAGSVALNLGHDLLERIEENRAGAALELRMQLWTRIEMGRETIVTRAKDMGNITAHRPEARDYTRVEALFAIRLATISLEVVAGLLM